MNVGINIPTELPAAAQAYAAAGIKVFRVRRNKAPYANCPRCDPESSLYTKHRPEDCECDVPTCHGFWSATNDVDLVTRWWTEEPDANIGAPCKLNGWAVIDVDPRNGGYTSLCGIEARVGVLPGTTMQITGGDGLHMLYLSPGFDLPKEPFPGVEFKHNNYVVLAPSVHQSGCRYQWPGTENTFFKPETPWPSTLLPRKERPKLSLRHHGRATSLSGIRRPGKHWTVDTLVQHVMDSREGDRNNRLYFAACRAHETASEGHLDLHEALSGLYAAASAVGLAERDAHATIESAANRPSDRSWAA
ncbi:DNA primase [Streptomyces sp. CB01201]|uniref:bifunctional DNA primase/polymerase n=1 Tax=Streptomyces sp. CB01201 TaxID=2020324 RepID=UPI000C27DA1C|nr:bifunctional DNA primase/polymerase [Streptomyces sp. CB01201]PJM98104.1 DNA primase [Streptomyces sp. CB01201]